MPDKKDELEYAMRGFYVGRPCSDYDPPRDPATHQHDCHKQPGAPEIPVMNSGFTVNVHDTLGYWAYISMGMSFILVLCTQRMFSKPFWSDQHRIGGKVLILRALKYDSVRWNMEILIQSVVSY